MSVDLPTMLLMDPVTIVETNLPHIFREAPDQLHLPDQHIRNLKNINGLRPYALS